MTDIPEPLIEPQANRMMDEMPPPGGGPGRFGPTKTAAGTGAIIVATRIVEWLADRISPMVPVDYELANYAALVLLAPLLAGGFRLARRWWQRSIGPLVAQLRQRFAA